MKFTVELRNVNDYINSFEVKKYQIDYTNVEEDLMSVHNKINKLCIDNAKH